jgi:amidohydrolase
MNEDAVVEMKKRIYEAIDQLEPRLVDLSLRIHRHPETKFKEYSASEWLAHATEEAGFDVEIGIGGLETAFRATYRGSEEGPVVAFLAEYDALPKLGHACGHNLIATGSLGAALGMKMGMSQVPGTLQLIGTPGEEGGGGKVILAEAGIFEDVDVAMMFHPSSRTILWKRALARRKLSIEFFGRSAHAASHPEKGISALDAILLTFQNINALREHIVDDARIHGIITDGGDAPNIVPDYSAALFYVRALDDDACDDLLENVRDCARAAALATGAEVKMDMEGAYRSLRTNMPLAEAFRGNLEAIGWTFEDVDPTAHIGSTDMGDVSHVTNTIHPYLSIGPEELVGHSTEFAEAAASAEGHRAMIDAAKALAATAADVLLRSSLLETVKSYFD